MIVMIGVATVLTACGGSDITKGPDSPLPAEQIETMQAMQTTDSGDEATNRRLIEYLDSSDPAVRLLAITLLEERTGQTLEFAYDQPLADRAAAVERWVNWQQTQHTSISTASQTSGAAEHD